MNATFKLDNVTTLVIGGSNEHHVYNCPTGPNTPPMVTLAVLSQVPLPPAGRPDEADMPWVITAETKWQEQRVVVSLPASHVRAIASALLSASTEARA